MAALHDSPPPSPSRDVIALHSEQDWQPILHSSGQVVLYNPISHALSISESSNLAPVPSKACPYCRQILPEGFEPDTPQPDRYNDSDPSHHVRVSDYFQLLANVHGTSSGSTARPPLTANVEAQQSRNGKASANTLPAGAMAEGYFKAFFREEYKLGMGANGSVFLCQHVLDGNSLGHFAVKKIAVGHSHSYLLRILREVRLLERLHHPNIVTYHHAWLETYQFSSFGPKVPTLYVLMQWAEGGSLDDYIDIRLGRGSPHVYTSPFGAFFPSPETPSTNGSKDPFSRRASGNDFNPSDMHSRSARIRAFRAYQRASPEEKERMRRDMLIANGKGTGKKAQTLKAVHLLSADEVKSLFHDVVEGLHFLHNRSILHLDLKPGNVLLTWDEGKLIPRAMLSDFGTSRDMIVSNPIRSGNTGTLEYSSPESLPSPQTGLLQDIDSKSDMWSLGMILHKLLFFKLPYRYAADGDASDVPTGVRSAERKSRIDEDEKLKRLEQEVLHYSGFKSTQDLVTAFEARRLPPAFLYLLEGLLNRIPSGRPSCEKISIAIREGKLDPLKDETHSRGIASLVPVARTFFSGDDRVQDIGTESESDVGVKLLHTVGEDSSSEIEDEVVDEPFPEKRKLLSLPSPPLPSVPLGLNGNIDPDRRDTWKWRLIRALVKHREPLSRLLKSSLLVGKVLSISFACPISYGFPQNAMSSLLLGAALADATLEMEVVAHLGFLVFHIVALRIGCVYRWCCA